MKLVIVRVSFVDRDRPEDERQDAESTPRSLGGTTGVYKANRKAAGCRTRAASCCAFGRSAVLCHRASPD
jgi:hypothetical protein